MNLVLLIDADPVNRRRTRDALDDRFLVAEAGSVGQAQRLLRALMPDLILLREGQLGEESVGFVRALRSAPETAGIPLAVGGDAHALTGATVGEDRAESLAGNPYLADRMARPRPARADRHP